MNISKDTANQIVTELGEIIVQKINIMNESGIIIASTDKKRLNTIHEGSRLLIENNLQQLIVHSDEEYPGSLKGLNLPIEMDGKCIGVIGITGEYEDIAKYGQIIKKMTEILLLDDSLKRQRKFERDIRNSFILEWIIDRDSAHSPLFANRGRALGIDITIPRYIIIFSPVSAIEDPIESQNLLNEIERVMRSELLSYSGSLIAVQGRKFYCLVPLRSVYSLRIFANDICKKVKDKCNVVLASGADSKCSFEESAFNSCLRADKALRGSLNSFEHTPLLYDDINLEIFIHDIPLSLRKEYVNKIFSDIDEDEQASAIHMLKVLFSCNGSLQATADKLYIHKNTLQYKLNKLYSQTGINPRTMEGTALYYVAISIVESMSQE